MLGSRERLQFYPLCLIAFVNSFGLIAITTLLPTYIDLLDPSGLAIGFFITGMTLAQTVAAIPISWAGDRFDKRAIRLVTLLTCAGAYALFPLVASFLLALVGTWRFVDPDRSNIGFAFGEHGAVRRRGNRPGGDRQ